jgi:hypothetical protein
MRTRYPGVSPFTNEQQNIFFGRDNDIKRLSKIISLREQILVYAKSGVGKTSLLNTGVLPLLEDKYKILKIRFRAYDNKNSPTPVNTIINLLNNSFKKHSENTFLDKIADNKKTLWYYFKKHNLLCENKEDFILVFDQFEELFTYPETQINEFKEQIHDLVYDNLPNAVKQFIADHPEIEDRTEVLFDDMKIKTVYAIRSDRLNQINTLTDKLPDIQKNFYELNPLDNEQAKQAVVNPAKNSDDFTTKAYDFEDKAIKTIIDALSNYGKQNIETTQLQIICEQIEAIAQEKYKNSLNHNIVKITQADLPEFDDIFLNFYQESIKKLKNTDKKIIADVQKFIEDQLIRNHQRISLDEIICNDYVSKDILLELVNEHLIRSEQNTTGGFSYELSHDTLVEPILISRKKRIKKEEEANAEAERQEELRKAKELAEKERKERKRKETITDIAGAAVIIILILCFFVFNMWQKAEKQREKAEKALKRADEMQLKVETAIFDKAAKDRLPNWKGMIGIWF